MSPLDQALRDLGCDHMRLERQAHIPAPEESTEEMLKRGDATTLDLLVGLVLATSPRLRRVETSALRAELSLHTVGGDFSGIVLYGQDLVFERCCGAVGRHIEDADGAALAMVLELGGCCMVDAGAQGRVVLLRNPTGEFEVGTVLGPTQPDWLQHDPEPWLDLIKQEALSRQRIGPALAAGHHLRFHDPPPEQLADILRRSLAGEPTPRQATVRTWLQDQTSEQLENWGGLARGMAVRTLHALDTLDAELRLDDDDWGASLGELLEERDDLASLARLLELVDGGAKLTEALAGLDDGLHLFLRSLPVEPRVDSERLQRAGLREADAWWTDPAART